MGSSRRVLALTIVGLLTLGVVALADTVAIETGTSFSINLNSGNYRPSDPCGGVTPGETSLLDLQYLPRQNAFTNDFLAALYTQHSVDTSNEEYTLIYQYSVAEASLAGTLLIDWYKAFDEHSSAYCYHGAEIVAYYDYAPGEETLGLDWVQLYDESGGSVHSPYDYTVDGFGDQSPAYYEPGLYPWTPAGYTLQSERDMAWSDRPHDRHLEEEAWSGSVEFYLFLAAFGDIYPDPNSRNVFYRNVTIYDGIVWGYYGYCYLVPEPATAGLFLIGLVGVCFRRIR